jgi:predicted GIY-YIG superfamily endonuclease
VNTNKKMKKSKYWVMVVEINDVVPRRDPKKPNLYVAITIQGPSKRFEALTKGKGPKGLGLNVVKLRNDLSSGPFFLRENANKKREQTIKRLKSAGFTVNGDTTVWTVYVIELDPKGTSKPGKGFIYVGMTSKSPEERFEEHRTGAKNKRGPLFSRVVLKYGCRLRMDLAPRRKYFDQASAMAAEKRWCQTMKDRGYNAVGGR